VIGLLETSPNNVPEVAAASIYAAEKRLRELRDDPSLAYCFWLLTRITAATRETDFRGALASLGLDTRGGQSTLAFIAQVSDHLRYTLASETHSGPFTELSSLALRKTLTTAIGEQQGVLLGGSVDQLQAALRPYATEAQFGVLSRRFFADFLSRTLRLVVERELSNHVGPDQTLNSISASLDFTRAMDSHTFQSARIVEDFAGDWYSTHNWQSGNRIERADVQRFIAVALRKLRTELQQASA
jgi:hypothetical protein